MHVLLIQFDPIITDERNQEKEERWKTEPKGAECIHTQTL